MNISSRAPFRRSSRALAAITCASVGAALLAGPVAARAQSAASPATSYPIGATSVAWTGQNTVIAGTDSNGDLLAYVQPPGSTKWVTELVAQGAGTSRYTQPSIAWTGRALAVAAIDGSGDLVFFTAAAGSATWNEQTVALADPGTFSYQAPSLTVAVSGWTFITAATTSPQNSADTLYSFTQVAGTGTWTQNLVASGAITTSSITTSQGLAFVTAADGGALDMWWEAISQPGWVEELVDNDGHDAGGTVSTSNSLVWITAYNATAGSVQSYDEPIAEVDSDDWTRTVVTSGSVAGPPQIWWTGPTSSESSGYDVITATSRRGALLYWWTADAPSPSWRPETVAGSSATAIYAMPSLTATATSVDIAAVNSVAGNLYNWSQPFGTTPWPRQLVAKG